LGGLTQVYSEFGEQFRGAVQSVTSAVQELVPLLVVESISRSVAFYRERLGFEMTQSWDPDGVLTWCRMERNGAALMIQLACEADGPAAGRGRAVTFYFDCDDVAAIHREFTAAGLQLPQPERAFYGMDQFDFTDPKRG
jgi:uncharacterized glyoxalase superfamily protein PhnB